MDPIKQTLRDTGLFDALSEGEFDAISQTIAKLNYPAGTIIANEGDPGDECYVIYQGTVQVFIVSDQGEEITLVKREVGEFIGEQALLPGTPNKRNASLRADNDVTLLVITKADFLRVVGQDSPLRQQLVARGEAQVRDMLLRQSDVFRALQLGGLGEWCKEETFAKGDVIFRQGDDPQRAYLIISGEAGIYEDAPDSNDDLIMTITIGRTFGEKALLENQKRNATIIAHNELTTLSIDGAHFLNLHQQSPELQEYMQTLKKIYPLANRGVVTQYFGTFADMDCLTTVTSLVDGRTAVSSLVIGQEIFNLSLTFNKDITIETITYKAPDKSVDRELIIADGHIVSVTAYGHWIELGQVYRMVLEGLPIDSQAIDSFRETGFFDPSFVINIQQDSDIVCNCLQITRGELRQAIEAGAFNDELLMEATGAGSVCGACRMSLREMVGQADWTPVQLIRTIAIAEEIQAFRFAPHGRTLEQAKPGQHVLIQAHIDGHWVQRPYTISSSAQELAYREITVKREPHGLFSNWLFDNPPDDALIRISDPQGDYYTELEETHPVVCLVGGIGMTPAMAMCRSFVEADSTRPLYIDYSANRPGQLAHIDELKQLANDHENISLNTRITDQTGHMKQAQVQQITQQYPNAHFYICGPEGYQAFAEQALLASGVANSAIHIEEFTHVGNQVVAAPGRGYFYLGLGLVAAFLLQDIFQLKMEWLESLQAGENFRRWTGVALTLYLAGQFILPAMRLRGDIKASARHYHLHKIQGAFAPLVYFIHATSVGYAYLLFLSVVYFANFILGLFNQEIITTPAFKLRYQYYWLISHILLSVLTIALLLAHIYLVFAYQ